MGVNLQEIPNWDNAMFGQLTKIESYSKHNDDDGMGTATIS